MKEDPLSNLVLAMKVVKGGGTYFSKTTQGALVQYMKELEKDERPRHPFERLSPREREIFCALADGKSVKETAGKFRISPKTVESHKYNIFQKLNVETVVDITKIAMKEGLVQ